MPPVIAHRFHRRGGGFSLIEVVVASGVFMLMVAILFSVIGQTSTVTQRAGDKITNFQGARAAFDTITRNLSQATLNSYWDYYPRRSDNSPPGWSPERYIRQSELHFLILPNGGGMGTPGTGQAIFFQAPLGLATNATLGRLQTLLNSVGYFIRYEPRGTLPGFPSSGSSYRYQLMQAIEPTEDLSVYASTTGMAWTSGLGTHAVPVADNIVFLSFWPRLSPSDDPGGTNLSPNYSYNSRDGWDASPQPRTAHQLPPVVQVTMIAIDENSAIRLCTTASPPLNLAGRFTSASSYEEDIEAIEGLLSARGANFRVYTAMIPLRESRME
jgi:uncharacterized protein (TIGR02599 family)